MRLAIASGFIWLMLAAAPASAADHHEHLFMTHDIQLIALPYLHLYQNRQAPAMAIERHQYLQDLSTGRWRITLTSVPQYSSHSGVLRTIDAGQATGPELDFRQVLIIPLPLPPGPVTMAKMQRRPLWLQIDRLQINHVNAQAWHAPALTPAAAALALAEQKRKQRLAKRMADRAFYFGYDTNKDALK